MKGVPEGKDYLTHRREKGVKRAEQNARNRHDRITGRYSEPLRVATEGYRKKAGE